MKSYLELLPHNMTVWVKNNGSFFSVILSRPCFLLPIDNIEWVIVYSSPWLGLVTVCLFTLGTSIDYMGNVLIIFYWTVISQHTHSLMWLYLPNDPDKLSFDEDTLEFIQLESRKSLLIKPKTSAQK